MYWLFAGTTLETSTGEQLTLERMAGVFVIILSGMVGGIFCLVCEFFLAAYKDTLQDKAEGVSFK